MGVILNQRMPTEPNILLPIARTFLLAHRIDLDNWQGRFIALKRIGSNTMALFALKLIADGDPLTDLNGYDIGYLEVQRKSTLDSQVRLDDRADNLRHHPVLSTCIPQLSALLQKLAEHLVTETDGATRAAPTPDTYDRLDPSTFEVLKVLQRTPKPSITAAARILGRSRSFVSTHAKLLRVAGYDI